MYLSAEQLAMANQAIKETFENSSIAWQIVPHWDVGDPAQTSVANDIPGDPKVLPLTPMVKPFSVTLVQISEPSISSLLTEVVTTTTALAQDVDDNLLDALYAAATPLPTFHATQQALLDALIDARAVIEDNGFRAPSSLITNTQGLKVLSSIITGYPIADALLETAHVNSVRRTSKWFEMVNAKKKDGNDPNPMVQFPKTTMIMLGRRQLIPDGGAWEASPGEEPVDLAVSVRPSLEVIGEAPNSEVCMSVRINYALRIKEPKALVSLPGIPEVE